MIGGYEKIISEGLPPKEFKGILDRYLMRENIKTDTDDYHRMNENQQRTIDDIKKSFKRVNYKLNKK